MSSIYPGSYLFELLDQELLLLNEKAIFWANQYSLLLSDLHLGKANHFLRSGIPLPTSIHDHDLSKLEKLVDQLPVREVIILGDLFHSKVKEEFQGLKKLVHHSPKLKWTLVLGNHDVLQLDLYDDIGLITTNELIKPPFVLRHQLINGVKENYYPITGHVHPGVSIKGKARQHLVLPCFYFGQAHAYLPAFGAFTGCVPIKPHKNDRLFAITPEKVIDL